MRKHAISSYELWRHPSWRRESWAMMRSGWCSSALHSTIIGRYSSGTFSTWPGILILILLRYFYFLSFSFCLVVDIRIVFLLVIVLRWNLGCCWAIDGYDHRFYVFYGYLCVVIGGVDRLVYLCFWCLVLSICVVLFWFWWVFWGECASLYMCAALVLLCVIVLFCVSCVWFCFLCFYVFLWLMMTHSSQWGHCEI